jgi:serine/threonine protein kinase
VSVASATHCINPDCLRPHPQPWGNKFCNSCGASLELKNRYIPLQLLGSGGFATIYTVWDLQTKTEKVLKVLVETAPKALELFEQEAAVLASCATLVCRKLSQKAFLFRQFHIHKCVSCLV